MIRRPCIVRGCREYAAQGSSRCIEHRREHARSRWDAGYTGSRGSRPGWLAIRRRVWREQGRRCVRCGGQPARFFVHHKDGNARNNERANLEGLCQPCHKAADAAVRASRRRGVSL